MSVNEKMSTFKHVNWLVTDIQSVVPDVREGLPWPSAEVDFGEAEARSSSKL